MNFPAVFLRLNLTTGAALAAGLLAASRPAAPITTEQLTARMVAAINGLQCLRCNVKEIGRASCRERV